MKLRKNCLILIPALIALCLVTSCIFGEKKSFISLSAVDSLGFKTDRYEIGSIIDLKYHWDKLYILDQRLNQLLVFNEKDLNFVGIIGKKGKGPGEFIEPMNLGFTSQDTLLVIDLGNGRLQYLDLEGNYLYSRKSVGFWSISQYKDQMFMNKFAALPDAGIYSIEQDSTCLIFDAVSFFNKQNYTEIKQMFFTFTAYEKGFVVSFIFNKRVILLSNDGLVINPELDLPEFEYPNFNPGKAAAYGKGFLLPVKTFPSQDKVETSEYYVIEYDKNGNINNVFALPLGKEYFLEGFCSTGEYFYLSDFMEAIVYKFPIIKE